ncbi:S41 family peptidase [Maribacter sp. PR1]|uniref:Tricorn protease homolog n=1 Tax=Maribacter cobaltidurans TaxID=1178778 RepID=A0ABU7IZ48_9FLAO|nr:MULTISPECIES: S41 family peptidase [Maribacter]MDC6390885.1 S41 family peptidase [Maribacter sp. PR1]MEE1978277.1 S41 family peptidase [Maribacter cobaltidurans]
MNKLLFLFFLTFYSFTISTAQESYFLLDPTLSPDASTIIFSYDSDLWSVSSKGGTAVRLTAMEGNETLPSISPDGKWLAFSGTQFGNKDVFIMPLDGGEVKQLTFNDANDDMDSWSWNSEHIYFTSSRYNRYSGYEVSISGDTPKRLFQNYFNTVANIATHPITGEIFFNESWEAKNFTHRKRYKGAYNPDIKSYNPETKEYKEYTSYNGKDLWATLDKSGNLFFVSDEANDEYNLYQIRGNQKSQLTDFESSIGRPNVSANGELIVFSKDYQIFTYNVKNGTATKVPIKITRNNTLKKKQDFKVQGNISNFSVSPDNKKLAFVSRGVLFVSDIKGKFIKHIPIKKGERVLEVLWLKDNKTLFYNRTHRGYTNLFTIAADGSTLEKQHTDDLRNNVNLLIDPDFKKALYISGRDELRLLDLSSFKSELLLKDEFWALYAPQPYFSPNGSHIVYNAIRNFESDVFVIRLSDKKITNLTNTGVSESSPVWSPDGKYLYMVSNLVKPSYPYGLDEAQIYQMPLDKYEDPYSSEKLVELFKEEEKKEEEDKKEDENKKGEKEKELITIKINEEGIMDRITAISPSFGRQRNPTVIKKDDAQHILYLSNHDEGETKLWKTVIEPFKKNKIEKVLDEKISGYQIARAKDDYYLLGKGNLHTFDVEKNKADKIDMDHTFRKNLSEEFSQMFHEAWAGFEENFYDGEFHGADWTVLRKKYEQYLPYITNRGQLRLLFNDMLGELNTSHFGFRSSGDEEDEFYDTKTLATGIQFSNDQPFMVDYIIQDGPADISGKNIKKGDLLVAVNGIPIDSKRNRESYFNQPSLDEEMELKFSRSGKTITVNLHPASTNTQRNLLYDLWVDENQKYVDEKADKKIAYVHMKNMGGGELENFKREMVSETNQREALILDLRYNTGGNVHDEVLQFLSQKPYLKWKYRDGALAPQPNFAPAVKPIILLMNEQSLSDAEMTAAGFKALGLGKTLGTETYRWIIFTSGKGLVDGSFYRLPAWGCFTLDGKNLEKTGVKPDIKVPETFSDRLEGSKPQLDRAIQEILQQL